MPRLSLSSRLVLVVVAVAVVLVAIAVLPRGGPSTPDAGDARATPTASRVSDEPSTATSAPGQPPPSPNTVPSPGTGPLVALIEQLPVVAEHRTGYSRNLFRHWVDADGDGCDTRHEVLIDEAVTAPHVGSGCRLTGGTWISPYDGVAVTDASALDIDHLVPLAEAWDSGAYAWSAQRRQAFANDLGVGWALVAVTAASNRSKGDQDPADWLPPLRSDRCTYLVDWVAVKIRWNLSVDPVERRALLQDARGCGSARVPPIPRG